MTRSNQNPKETDMVMSKMKAFVPVVIVQRGKGSSFPLEDILKVYPMEYAVQIEGFLKYIALPTVTDFFPT